MPAVRIAVSGDYAITFSAANDGDGTGTPTTAAMTVRIHVNHAYAAPVVTPVANQKLGENTTLDIPVQAVDPDGSRLVDDRDLGKRSDRGEPADIPARLARLYGDIFARS